MELKGNITLKILNEFYVYILMQVKEEDVDISWYSGYGVGEGIVELIYQNNITKLVMGAAADPHYSR